MFGIDISATAARIGIDNFFRSVQSFLFGLVVPKTYGTGIKIDTDSPNFGYADILGEIVIRFPSAGTTPTFAAYLGGIYQYSFGTGAGVVEVFMNYHIPHDLLSDGGVWLHSHWSTAAAPTGNVNWMYEVAYSRGYGRGTFEGFTGTAATATCGVTAAATTALKQEISEVQIATPGGPIEPAVVNVSITSGTPTLTSASALFTAGDIDRTVRVIGAGAAGGNLDTTITAFTSTQQVTLGANASTTVTAQPNFRYRVIDADLFEPDGVILCRCYRDSARAADTLNVAPFLHFVDMHYQTNGIVGTKNKNWPFYT